MEKTNKNNALTEPLPESNSLVIDTLSHEGRGIATIAQKKVFIDGVLPSEIVTYKILRKHRRYYEAESLTILNPSPNRVNPPCEHFTICGGCSLQHMSTDAQLMHKQETLLNHLRHFGKVIPENILTPLNVNSIAYRHKARLGAKFVFKKNKMLVGFREKSSRYLADIKQCIVLHPHIGQKLSAIGDVISSLETYDQIPQVEFAMGDHLAALVFRHLKPLSVHDLNKLLEFGKNYDFHIYLQPNPPDAICKLWPQDNLEYLSYTLPDHQLEFLFHPLDFTQINLAMNRAMINQTIHLLELNATETVLDLFCGIGNFTLAMARYAKHVIGVEVNEAMVNRAKNNAAHNHIRNVEFYAANLVQPKHEDKWMHKTFDKVLLDPPRTGAKEVLPFIRQASIKKIAYISCNPATLARDADILVNEYGYQLKKVGIMNMFPHTSHIETIGIFEK